jgi:hypothetical protein
MRNAIPLSFGQFVSVHLLLLSALLGFFKGFQTEPNELFINSDNLIENNHFRRQYTFGEISLTVNWHIS